MYLQLLVRLVGPIFKEIFVGHITSDLRTKYVVPFDDNCKAWVGCRMAGNAHNSDRTLTGGATGSSSGKYLPLPPPTIPHFFLPSSSFPLLKYTLFCSFVWVIVFGSLQLSTRSAGHNRQVQDWVHYDAGTLILPTFNISDPLWLAIKKTWLAIKKIGWQHLFCQKKKWQMGIFQTPPFLDIGAGSW